MDMTSSGFTTILLHFSFADWIINYPIVSPFAANGHIGELGGGGGKGGGGGGANKFSVVDMQLTEACAINSCFIVIPNELLSAMAMC